MAAEPFRIGLLGHGTVGGAFAGGMASGWVVDHFTGTAGKDWRSIWLTFAGYALVLGIVFPLVFKYRHDPKKIGVLQMTGANH